VPGHISCEFAETGFIKPLEWIARRLHESRHWYISIFTVVRRDMAVHFVISYSVFCISLVEAGCIQNGMLSAAADSATGGGLYEAESGSE
jgi:hypothetical protein